MNGFNAIVEACKKVGLQLSIDSGTMKECKHPTPILAV